MGSIDALSYRTDRHVDRQQLIELYRSVGWGAYTSRPDDFGPMIDKAALVISVHDCLDTGDRLVGLLRVVGDGASIAYIQDLLVHPDYQHQGIGGRLLDLALQQTAHVRQTVLMTDAGPDNEHVVQLYRRKGFALMPDEGCVGLVLFR